MQETRKRLSPRTYLHRTNDEKSMPQTLDVSLTVMCRFSGDQKLGASPCAIQKQFRWFGMTAAALGH